MRKIYVVVHKASYGDSRKVLRAFESEQDAKDTVSMMEGIVTGSLEVTPIELVPPSSPLSTWRFAAPEPSIDLTPRAFIDDESRILTSGGAVLP